MNAERLALLHAYGVLDTPAESEFDDIAEVAAALCGTPTALINLIDTDRQWFKARVGMAATEMPILQSVCIHGLAGADLLIVPDLTADPRTCEIPAVAAVDGARFYAGAPLIAPEGLTLGMLCVVDTKPRPEGLTPAQAAGLRVLARQTMRLLDIRRAAQTERLADARLHDALAVTTHLAQKNAARYRAAQQAAGIGTFEIDIATNVMTISEEFCRLFGMPIRTAVDATEFLQNILEEDRGLASNEQSRRLGELGRDAQYRIRRADDGRIRWLSRRGAFVRDDAGQPIKMFGVVQDITEERLGRDRIAALLALGDRLRVAAGESEVVEAALDTLIGMLGAARVGYARLDRAADKLTVERDRTDGRVRSLVGVHALSRFPATLLGLLSGEALAAGDLHDSPGLAADRPTFDAMGVRAAIQVPLMEDDDLVGVVFVHETSPRAWSSEEINFVEGATDRMEAAMARARAEAAQEVLNLELSHRLKNSFAMVQALAMQTLKPVADRGPVENFDSRLHALAAAHDLLLQRSWSTTALLDILTAVGESLAIRARLDLSGPRVMLGSKSTLATSLLIHELATNALKYGSLSADGGRVEIRWDVDSALLDPALTVTWREYDGPPTAPPGQRGFGSRLIGMGLVGRGGARVDYGPDGLVATFTSPMSQIATSL
ncbi:MAG: GAF domain-containing protein [Caulobacterales bacterium]|nr:GAF domain-containing protein [Caulobacterales bacterium]